MCVCDTVVWVFDMTSVCVSAQREAKVYVASSSSNLVSDREDCGKQGDRQM